MFIANTQKADEENSMNPELANLSVQKENRINKLKN